MSGYLDFDLEIGLGEGRQYPLAVLRSPAGEARATLQFPFDEIALERYQDKLKIALLSVLGKRRSATPEEHAVQEFGGRLFEALLVGEVRSRYDVSLAQAAAQRKGLRLRLHIRAPELAALPWELLYDPRQGEYIGLSQKTPLVRYIDLPQPCQPLLIEPPRRILGMLASPRDADLPQLDIDVEKLRLERALADLRRRGLLELEWIESGTWRDLQRALRHGPWHIFHFIGHGRYNPAHDEGELALVAADGGLHPFRASELARLLGDHEPLRLAVLNACEGGRGGGYDIFSSTASILVRRGLPAVLAMQYAISDRAAIELAQTFYEALADGLPVDACVSAARIAISLERHNTVEWGTPVLYLRAEDGVLFSLQSMDAGRQASGAGQQTTDDGQQPSKTAAQAASALETARRALAHLENQAAGYTSLTIPVNLQIELDDKRKEVAGLEAGLRSAIHTSDASISEASDADKGMQARGKKPEAPVNLGDLYYQGMSALVLGEWQQAQRHFAALVDADPGYRDAAARLAQVEAQLQLAGWYTQAVQRREVGDWQGVLKLWAQITEQQADYEDAENVLSWAQAQQEAESCYIEALEAMQSKDWPAAQQSLQRLLALNPDHPLAPRLLDKAQAELAARQRREAEQEAQWRKQQRDALVQKAEQTLQRSQEQGLSAEQQGELLLQAGTSMQELLAQDAADSQAQDMLAQIQSAIHNLQSEITISLAPNVSMTFLRIPAGEFWMGSSDADQLAYDDEKPQHKVRLSEYWIAKYPVTVAQFAAFVKATEYKTTAEKEGTGWAFTGKEWQEVKGASWHHPRGAKSDIQNKADHPVTQISWHDAVAFCQWAGQVSGHSLRLPTEAEWEKAARGADGRLYPWGNEAPDAQRCNFKINVTDTTPVGKYSPLGDSPYGCVDMAGNVWEWTNSLSRGYPYQAGDGREKQEATGSRVLRGGAWLYGDRFVRSAYRHGPIPAGRLVLIGFRPARSP